MTLTTPERIVLVSLIVASGGFFAYEIWRRLRIVNRGQGKFPLDRVPSRLMRVVREVFFHQRVVSGRHGPGVMHALVFWGFVVFAVVTLDHFGAGFGFPLLSPGTRRLYSLFVIPVALLVIVGISALAYRRFVVKPPSLGKLSPSSGLVALFIFVLMITYLFGETNPPVLPAKVNWWIHTGVILAFLVLIPRSKHLHLVLAPFNIFFRPFETPEHAPVTVNLEGSEEELEATLENLKCLSRNQALDVFSCVECGRCTEVCPAHRGGGILDPKHHFILDLRGPMLESKDVAVLDRIDPDAGWECTTCQACTYACPVGNQVEKSEEIRNLQVLVEGQVPGEFQKLFMNLREAGNTEGAHESPLDGKFPPYTPDKEYVLWLGCFARYELDPQFSRSVVNFTRILDAAGVTYGILKEEWCSGDPALRLGEKTIYHQLREHNLQVLSEAKKVVTLCPHCLVNLGREYAKYGPVGYRVEHHTRVIAGLLDSGRITVRPDTGLKPAFHDPCNLARMMNEVEAPRRALGHVVPRLTELPEHGKRPLCGGAGGGLWWKKEGVGRTHLLRARQIVDSDCDTVVTACNFCFGMFN
ncbi:MAG: (Fe-S)-binding protein, partial [Fidelibacterota bacterium]